MPRYLPPSIRFLPPLGRSDGGWVARRSGQDDGALVPANQVAVACRFAGGAEVPPDLALVAAQLEEAGVLSATEDADDTLVRTWDAAGWLHAAHYFLSSRRVRYDYADGKGAERDAAQMASYVQAAPEPTVARPAPNPAPVTGVALPAAAVRGPSLASALAGDAPARAIDGPALLELFATTLMAQTLATTANPHLAPVVLRPVPSNGARHPLEVTAGVRDVPGVPDGWHHVQFAARCLTPLPMEPPPAGVTLRVTAVVGRSQFRYRDPKSYLTLALELGHLLAILELACRANGWRLETVPPTGPAALDELPLCELRLSRSTGDEPLWANPHLPAFRPRGAGTYLPLSHLYMCGGELALGNALTGARATSPQSAVQRLLDAPPTGVCGSPEESRAVQQWIGGWQEHGWLDPLAYHAAAFGGPTAAPRPVTPLHSLRTAGHPLPSPPLAAPPLALLLQARRSTRSFAPGAVSQADLGAVLRHAQPKSLRLFVAAQRIADLPPAIYEYDAVAHALARHRDPVDAAWLRSCLSHQIDTTDVALVVFAVADFAAAQARQPSDAGFFQLHVDAGHACQRMWTTAQAVGLAGYTSHGIAAALTETLELDPQRHFPIYAFAAGRP